MIGRDGGRTARSAILALAILSGVLFSCAPSRGLILTDPALMVLDPEGAKAYSSFRAAGTRWTAREYPARDSDAFFGEFAALPPAFVLLTPLLSLEYSAVRKAFPEALIVGTGIPAGGRSVSAAWDPVPAAREAGIRAGTFLRDRGEGLPEPPEAVILVSGNDMDDVRAAEAFREGLESARPGTVVRSLELPVQPAEADSLVRGLTGPGAKAVFLDTGAGGFRAARLLAEPPAPPESARGPRFTVLRSALPPPPEAPADILLIQDTRTLLNAFREALKGGRTGPITVPETQKNLKRRP